LPRRRIGGSSTASSCRTSCESGPGVRRQNLPAIFALANGYVSSERFIAVSESPEDDLDILNAAIVLEPGDYVVLRSLRDDLNLF